MKNKLSTIFMISILALAGIGISYAGFIDELKVYGTVDTATVDLEIEEYSGTYVWKIWGEGAPGDEVFITHDPEFDPSIVYPNAEYMLVSSAEGRDPTASDPPDYDGIMEFDNLFPAVDFMADIVFHYVGSIPVKITSIEWDWTGEPLYDSEGTLIADDWIQWLMDNGYMTFGFYWYDPATGELGEEVGVGTQLHYSHRIKLIVTIHLPQENFLQGLSGSGWVDIEVMQWNDECDVEPEEVDIGIEKTVNNPQPDVGSDITYTITATNYGPDDASDVMVFDLLPSGLTYVSDNPSQGSYNPVSGFWNVGSLVNGASATLEITATVVSVGGGGAGFTQLAMVLDGSGSIAGADWTIMINGLADAIRNYLPHDGSVELTVIQFAQTFATLEVGPIVVDGTSYEAVATAVEGIVKRGDYTPLACGLNLAADTLAASLYFDTSNRQVINVVTDGVPNVDAGGANGYSGVYVGEAAGKAAAETARDYLIATLGMTNNPPEFGGDEFDAEAVGPGPDVPWLRDEIVWPQPGYDTWPPAGPGWVRAVSSYEEFADTIGEKFQLIFEPIENCAGLVDVTPEDINPLNDGDCVTITPQLI